MAGKEWQLLEERLISGRGLFRIPANDAYRHFYLYINVVRIPRVNWTNSKWNPDRSEYAKITWIRDKYVLREDVLNYENQLFEYSPDPSNANYINQGMVCLYEQIIGYLDYLAPFIPAPPLPDGEPIPIEPLKNTPDEIKIVCRESTAINCKLYYLEYEEACGSATSTPKEPPDPEPEPQQPEFAPIGDITPPYQEPNDDGDTVPYQGDENPPPPPTSGVWNLTVTIGTGGTAVVTYPGISTDTWEILGGVSASCGLPGRSQLIKNGVTIVEDPFNCNSAGFVSVIVDEEFVPGSP